MRYKTITSALDRPTYRQTRRRVVEQTFPNKSTILEGTNTSGTPSYQIKTDSASFNSLSLQLSATRPTSNSGIGSPPTPSLTYNVRQTPAALALSVATSTLISTAILAHLAKGRSNRRVIEDIRTNTTHTSNDAAVAHPTCPVDFGSGDILVELVCPTPYANAGPTCDPALRLNTLELDYYWQMFIPICEVGDGPGTDLIDPLPLPMTSPVSQRTDVGKFIAGDLAFNGTRGYDPFLPLRACLSTEGCDNNCSVFQIDAMEKAILSSIFPPPADFTFENLNLKSIIAGLTVLIDIRKRPFNVTITRYVQGNPSASHSMHCLPREGARFIPTMIARHIATTVLTAIEQQVAKSSHFFAVEAIPGVLQTVNLIREELSFEKIEIVVALTVLAVCLVKALLCILCKLSWIFGRKKPQTTGALLSTSTHVTTIDNLEMDAISDAIFNALHPPGSFQIGANIQQTLATIRRPDTILTSASFSFDLAPIAEATPKDNLVNDDAPVDADVTLVEENAMSSVVDVHYELAFDPDETFREHNYTTDIDGEDSLKERKRKPRKRGGDRRRRPKQPKVEVEVEVAVVRVTVSTTTETFSHSTDERAPELSEDDIEEEISLDFKETPTIEVGQVSSEASSWSSKFSRLNPEAPDFVPVSSTSSGSSVPAPADSNAIQPPAVPTRTPISARPPGRRRRKHHRKNKNKEIEDGRTGGSDDDENPSSLD
ncbi:unnamed protein product [Cyclocybe aegerita]|uniref:Uncharacterized protein n=1 Tax=Cyclocybe aegerita TaxID=1973307 RepID=A0A8S0WGP1_CYCAE|nr:unnamed protein product [Cyclocybe aegerita]